MRTANQFTTGNHLANMRCVSSALFNLKTKAIGFKCYIWQSIILKSIRMYNKSILLSDKSICYMKKWSGHTLFLTRVQDGSLHPPCGICLFNGYLYQVSVETEKRSRVTLFAIRLACMLGLVLRINLRIIFRTFNLSWSLRIMNVL